MELKQLLQDLSAAHLSGPESVSVTGICYDSRKAAPGCLFVAIRGFRSDGHAFITAALERGAAAVLLETPPEAPIPGNIPVYRMKNTRRGLAQAAAAFYGHPERELKLIGVTGTNGKTTSTFLIRHILEKTGHKCGLIGTTGVWVGEDFREAERTTPESLELYALLREMRDRGEEYCVMEVSSHSLVLDRVWGLHFQSAAFTNLTQDHLDFHGDMENYFQAKARLFDRCDTAVLNLDDPYGQRLAKSLTGTKLTFSAKVDQGDLIAKNIRLLPDCVQAVLVRDNDIARLRLGIPGMFSVYNALTAIGCCLAAGLGLEEASAALADAPGVKGRVEVVPTGQDFTVLIDYSHTPDSMDNILRTVRGFARGRVVGLFGAGGDRDKTKRPIMGRTAGELCDLAIVTSDNPRSEDPDAIIADILAGMNSKMKYKVIPDRREAIAWAVKHAKKDDILVLMGKGQETYQEIQGEKHHLDEREEVARALKSR